MIEIATFMFFAGILGLFVLDRDPRSRPSKALWLPVMWLLIAGSRPVSQWLVTAGWVGTAVSFTLPEQYLEGSPIDRSILTALLVAGLIVLIGRRTAVQRVLRANGTIFLFVLYCAVSICWSDYPDVAFKRWIKSLGDYVMILIVLTDRDRSSAVKQILARVGFLLLPLSVLVIKYYPDLGRSYGRWEGKQFFTGIAQDKNMLGMTCLVFGLAASWRVFHELAGSRRAKTLLVHGTILAMALWLFWMANSITSLAVFFLTSSLIAATTFLKATRKRVVVHFMVAAVVVACFATLFLDLGGSALKAMGRDPTLTGRTEIWKQLLELHVNPIFGTGFESFWLGKRLEYLWSLPGMQVNEAHNGYLEVYLNLGLIGVSFIFAIIVTAYRNIIRLLGQDPEAGRLRLAYFTAAVIYNFTEAAIRTTDLMWIALLFAAMALPRSPVSKVAAVANRGRDIRVGTTPVEELV